jgi:hypothetical protein
MKPEFASDVVKNCSVGTAIAIAFGSYLYFLSQTDDLLKGTQGDVEAVTGVSFSLDGKWVFSSGSRGLKRWNANTLKLDKEWKSIPAVFGELRIISRMTSSPVHLIYSFWAAIRCGMGLESRRNSPPLRRRQSSNCTCREQARNCFGVRQ